MKEEEYEQLVNDLMPAFESFGDLDWQYSTTGDNILYIAPAFVRVNDKLLVIPMLNVDMFYIHSLFDSVDGMDISLNGEDACMISGKIDEHDLMVVIQFQPFDDAEKEDIINVTGVTPSA